MYEPRVKRPYVGTYYPKIDAEPKARGAVEYFDDVTLEGRIPRMIYGKIYRSPYCNAKIVKLDTGKVESFPGVYGVVRYDDPEIKAIPQTTHSWTDTAITPMHRDTVPRFFDRWCLPDTGRWVGDHIGFAVAAESEEIAEEAMKLAEIEWEIMSKPFLDIDECMSQGAFVLHPEINPDSNRKPRYVDHKTYEMTDEAYFTRGDVDKAMAESDVIIEVDEGVGGQSQTAVMDLRGVAVDWRPEKMTVWTNHYFNEQCRLYLSGHLNVPMHKIRVLTGHIGAHMGRYNCGEDTYFLITALLSKKAGRPVKYRMDLREDFHETRNFISFKVKIGGKKDGTITAIDMQGTGNSGAYHGADMYPLEFICEVEADRMMAPIENYRTNGRTYYTNRVPGGVFRGIGNLQFNFPMCQALDAFAEAVNMDPVDIIIKNCGNIHNPNPNESLTAVLKTGAANFGWEKRNKTDAGPVYDETKKRGMGVAFHNQWHIEWQETARGQIECEMRILPDLKVILNAPTCETGAGGNSACVLACADHLQFLNVTPEDITWINHCDSEMGLRDVHASDSVVSFLLPELMPECAEKVKKEFIRRARPQFGDDIRESELDVADAKVFVKGAPDISIPCTEVMDDDCTCIKAYVCRGNNRNVTGLPYGAWFAEVEVDTELGTVEVLKITLVNDVGQVMHASGAESAQLGGQLLAIGETLYEELNYDKRTGTLLNANYIDYKIPLMCDYPKDVTPILKEVWRGAGEYGAAGLAEGTPCGTYAAIGNAIYNAVGIRVNTIPFKPEKILEKLAEKKAAEGGTSK